MTSSLDAFAEEARRAATRCLVCNLPDEVRRAVEDNESRPMKNRWSRRVVVAWAAQQGHTISTDSIYKHTMSNH